MAPPFSGDATSETKSRAEARRLDGSWSRGALAAEESAKRNGGVGALTMVFYFGTSHV